MPTVSTSVPRPNCRLPSSSSWPSCAIEVSGASIPVASAIATGNANRIATIGGDNGAPVIATAESGSTVVGET